MEDPDLIAAKIAELDRESAKGVVNTPPRTLNEVFTRGSVPLTTSGILSAVKTTPKVWQAFDGYNALTKFDFNNNSPLFTPGAGIPVKAFLNTRTGEIRVFAASIFEKLN